MRHQFYFKNLKENGAPMHRTPVSSKAGGKPAREGFLGKCLTILFFVYNLSRPKVNAGKTNN